MPRVVHFEIHAGEPERAIRFYEKVLGWSFQKWEGPMEYWLIVKCPYRAWAGSSIAKTPKGISLA